MRGEIAKGLSDDEYRKRVRMYCHNPKCAFVGVRTKGSAGEKPCPWCGRSVYVRPKKGLTPRWHLTSPNPNASAGSADSE